MGSGFRRQNGHSGFRIKNDSGLRIELLLFGLGFIKKEQIISGEKWLTFSKIGIEFTIDYIKNRPHHANINKL